MEDFKKFTTCKRRDGEDVKKFISRFNTLYNAAKKSGLVLKETAKTLFLFTAADLSESQMKMAVTKIDFSKETVPVTADSSYVAGAMPQTEDILKLFLGDLTKDEVSKTQPTYVSKESENIGVGVTSGLEDQVVAMQQQLAQLVGVVKNQKGKKEVRSGRKATDGKNPFSQSTGARLKCFKCRSESHLANTCSKPKVDGSSLQAPAQQTLHVSTLNVDNLKLLQASQKKSTKIKEDKVYVSITVAEIGSHALVLDTGSRSNVSGYPAVNDYIDNLEMADKLAVEKRNLRHTR